MPERPSLTSELHATLANLGAGAGDLWIQLWTRCEADGTTRVTEAQIAQAMGRSVRWVSKAAVALKQAGYLEGGHGMWKIRSTSDGEETFHMNEPSLERTFHDGEETFHIEPKTGTNVPHQTWNERSTSATPPSLTLSPPVCVREHNVVDVTFTVNERENDDDALSNPPPPSSLAGYSPEFEAFWKRYPKGRGQKAPSAKRWKQVKGDRIADQIMAGLSRWLECEQWDDPTLVVYAQRFLGDRFWENDPPEPAERRPKNGGYSREELLRQIAEDEGDDPLGDEENPGFAASRLAGDGDRRRADHGLPHHPLGLALPRGEWGRAVAHGRREVAAEAGRTARQGDHPARRDRPL